MRTVHCSPSHCVPSTAMVAKAMPTHILCYEGWRVLSLRNVQLAPKELQSRVWDYVVAPKYVLIY